MNPSPVLPSSLHPMVAGGASALITTILYQPLDFLKTQIQEPKHETSKRSVRSIVKVTVQDYSILRLWRGLIPSLVRAVPGSAIYFQLLNMLKQKIPEKHQTVFVNGLYAAFARFTADLALFPSTFIKARLESSRYATMSMSTIVENVFHTQGLRGFYTGLLPTLARDLPFSAIYYTSYRKLKEIFPHDSHNTSNHSWLASQVSISFAAGMIASFITQPADVVKTYRQVAPNDYRNIYATLKAINRADGFSGFARGFLLRAFRRTLVSATTWTLYESFLKDTISS